MSKRRYVKHADLFDQFFTLPKKERRPPAPRPGTEVHFKHRGSDYRHPFLRLEQGRNGTWHYVFSSKEIIVPAAYIEISAMGAPPDDPELDARAVELLEEIINAVRPILPKANALLRKRVLK